MARRADPATTTLIVGSAATDVRRSVGPTAWCVLEQLAMSAPSQVAEAWIVRSSVRELAEQLGVAKNTAQRALLRLRRARLVAFAQPRDSSGRFDSSSYRLNIPDDVLTRQRVPRCGVARSLPGSTSGSRRRVVAASPVGGYVEQLVLLPLA
jgi:DNA-binding transcriptional ArsR family regulator